MNKFLISCSILTILFNPAYAAQEWGDILFAACSMDPNEWCINELVKLCGKPNSKSTTECAKKYAKELFCRNWEHNVKPYRLCGNPALVETGPEAVKKCIISAKKDGCIK